MLSSQSLRTLRGPAVLPQPVPQDCWGHLWVTGPGAGQSASPGEVLGNVYATKASGLICGWGHGSAKSTATQKN